MNKKELWQIFMKTGKVSDYLNYKNARDSVGFPLDDEEEVSEEFASDYINNFDTDFPDIDEDINY